MTTTTTMKTRFAKVFGPGSLLVGLISVAIVAGLVHLLDPRLSRRELALGAAIGWLFSALHSVVRPKRGPR